MVINPQEPQKLVSFLNKKPLVLYGCGGMGASIAQWCDTNGVHYIFADQDAARKPRDTNQQIITPEQVAENFSNANIVISSIFYYGEIQEKLLALGICREHIFSYQMFLPEKITWRDLEHSTIWGMHTGRVELIAEWVPANARSIADYGAGKLSLQQFLEPSAAYYPIDYVKRSEETIVCDFDHGRLPNLQTDVAVCTATLVFIEHAEKLLEHICTHTAQRIILSYVLLETFPDIEGRRASGYLSDLAEPEIHAILKKYGFYLPRAPVSVPPPAAMGYNLEL